MTKPRFRSDLRLYQQENELLIECLLKFLLVINDKGAYFSELTALLKILTTSLEVSTNDIVIEKIIHKIEIVIAKTLPERLTIAEASDYFGIDYGVIVNACEDKTIQSEIYEENQYLWIHDILMFLLKQDHKDQKGY